MNKIKDSLHHLFAPKRTNNYRAKLLHHDFLTIYLIFALAVTAFVYHFQNQSGDVLGYATDVTVEKLFELTNVEREEANLSRLTYNNQLAEAAKKKAENMFENDYWDHYGPNGETPWTFILGSGYQYEYAGENLAKNFLFSDGVIKAWMESPTHRDNIVRKEYTEVGFAVVNGILNGEETTLVVQMFGTPLYGGAEEKADQPPVAKRPETAEIPQGPVLSEATDTNFYPVYLNVNIIFLMILIAALVLDIYFATKLNIIRLKGKNIIHALFLVFILVGTFILIKGSIV